jgi:hypothetical protein
MYKDQDRGMHRFYFPKTFSGPLPAANNPDAPTEVMVRLDVTVPASVARRIFVLLRRLPPTA